MDDGGIEAVKENIQLENVKPKQIKVSCALN